MDEMTRRQKYPMLGISKKNILLLTIAVVACIYSYKSSTATPLVLQTSLQQQQQYEEEGGTEDEEEPHENKTNTWPPSDIIENVILNSDPSSAQSRRLVVTAANEGYVDFADNFANSLLQLNVTNFVIVALDDAAHEKLKMAYPERTIPPLPHLVGGGLETSAAFRYGSAGFRKVTSTRPMILKAFLDLNVTVFYNDVDIVWRKNAWLVLDELLETLGGNSSDTESGATNDDSSEESRIDGFFWQDGETEFGNPQACTCEIFIKPTDVTKQLLDDWYDVIQNNFSDFPEDQRALNLGVPSFQEYMSSQELQIRVISDDSRFPTGGQFSWRHPQDSPDAVVVHNNWVMGKGKKFGRFRRSGLWNPSGRLVEVVANNSELNQTSSPQR